MEGKRKCPRCGERSLERFESHSHCASCLFGEYHAPEFIELTEKDLALVADWDRELRAFMGEAPKIKESHHYKIKGAA